MLTFEIRAEGSATNGGGFDDTVSSPGTDFSQQDAAQVAYTDLVIGSAGNEAKVTSSTHPFGSTHPGNIIYIASGTGFDPGWYIVLSVAGNVATLNMACGTATSTGGTGNLGGALDGIDTLDLICTTFTASGNPVYIKKGTYTASGSLADFALDIYGYKTTRGDKPTLTDRPAITMGANNFNALTVDNLDINFTDSPWGVSAASFRNCKIVENGTAGGSIIDGSTAYECELSASGTASIIGLLADYSYIHDSPLLISCVLDHCITVNSYGLYYISHSICYGAETPTGILSEESCSFITDSIIYGFAQVSSAPIRLDNCCLYNNTDQESNLTLDNCLTDQDPQFKDAAGGDFTVQNTALLEARDWSKMGL